MATPSSSQVIPFPLPSYLATYFANRITTETIILQDGTYAKPFHVKRNSAFGKFICRCFTKSEKPIFIEKGFTFFIKVEDHKTTQEKLTVNSRYSFLELSESTVNDIIEIFKELFEDNLKNYVSGAEDFGYGLTNKKRGVRYSAILKFCEKNNVIYTNKNLDAWKKMLYRHQKRVNANKHGVL